MPTLRWPRLLVTSIALLIGGCSDGPPSESGREQAAPTPAPDAPAPAPAPQPAPAADPPPVPAAAAPTAAERAIAEPPAVAAPDPGVDPKEPRRARKGGAARPRESAKTDAVLPQAKDGAASPTPQVPQVPQAPQPAPVPAAPAAPAAAAPAGPCGEDDEPMCPLQGWMDRHMQRALDAEDLPALATTLRRAAKMAPDPSWNAGDKGWAPMATAAATAADAGDLSTARKSCKGCHRAWRRKYKAAYRTRPVP